MKFNLFSRKDCLLGIVGCLGFAICGCQSPVAPLLSPEQARAYSDEPCVNARLSDNNYHCFAHTWAEPMQAEGLDNLNKVDSDYYRSAQPESGGFASAERIGIKTVISIRQETDDADLAEKEPTSLKLIHLPLSTTGVTDEDIGRVLKAVRTAEKPVLVHCRHGADRTGLVTAFYRIIFNDWTRDEAKNELLYGGFGHHTMFSNIPKLVLEADIEKIRAIAFND